jgi:hypothetical protein
MNCHLQISRPINIPKRIIWINKQACFLKKENFIVIITSYLKKVKKNFLVAANLWVDLTDLFIYRTI